MFSVKHIRDDGWEAIYPAEMVQTFEDQHVAPGQTGVGLFGPADRTHTVYGGTVYVMNDAGATVAKYVLG